MRNNKKCEATYLGRPRQRVIAIALEKALAKANLTEEQEDAIIFSFFGSITENNGAKPMGFAKYLGIEGE